MKKTIKLNPPNSIEHQLMTTCELTNQVRQDTMQDLENIGEDFKHLFLVIQSVQRNYQALLDQNQQLQSLLLNLVKDCYCWEGNRCQNCQKILQAMGSAQPKAIAKNSTNPDAESTEKYQDIVTQLRKRN
ncbi:conserved hypothetical protein [Planktothrix serta PCC 8927]|uniref:Uncharacterized protein n=1 Tax=Planktothrix serta PCC 8927 TaxID=671068 RepID=A0A7Z9BTR7_9CYAN|nr:hypothetical protein [Planktothrix serta]VXD17911.1 conserved hypothetical protein [Planktothrix serta PCC 8927]